MKKIFAGLATLVALAATAPANAADMPLKAPPPVWCDWCGFYVGVNGGYSWGRSTTDYIGTGTLFVPFSTSQNMDGWLGGAQIGYNWQINRNWLFGLEADIQGTGERGSVAFPPIVVPGAGAPATITNASLAQKLPWFGTVRMRIGFEPSNHWLLYATGGLAYGEVNTAFNGTLTTGGVLLAATSASVNNSRAGWTLGGGAEWWFADRWSAKLEYLYMDLGSFSDSFVGVGSIGATLATTSHVTDNIFRVGVNYHFGGPVVARY